VGRLGNTPGRIQDRQALLQADRAYCTGAAKGLGLDIDAVAADKQATAAEPKKQ